MCKCAVYNLTGSVFLGSFRVLEGAEESLAEIHREVLHFQICLQEETEAFFIYALQKQGGIYNNNNNNNSKDAKPCVAIAATFCEFLPALSLCPNTETLPPLTGSASITAFVLSS